MDLTLSIFFGFLFIYLFCNPYGLKLSNITKCRSLPLLTLPILGMTGILISGLLYDGSCQVTTTMIAGISANFAVICWLILFFDIWNLFLKHLYTRIEYVQVTWTRISNYWSWDSTTSKFKFRELKLCRLDYW